MLSRPMLTSEGGPWHRPVTQRRVRRRHVGLPALCAASMTTSSRHHGLAPRATNVMHPNRGTNYGPSSWSALRTSGRASARRSSKRGSRISSMSSWITFARIVLSPPNPSAS
jgi:hypothetical protein